MSVNRDASRGGLHAGRVVPRIAVGAAFAAVIVLIAAVAAWPIYQAGSFVLLVVAGALVGAGIAVAVWLRRGSGWLVAALLAAAILVLGVPLAVPSRLGGPAEIVRGLGELASGLVLGWKDLVTVELAVGSYRNLLVPALVIFLVGTCVMLLLAWREDRAAYGAVPVALAMVSFGLFFGRTTVSAPLRLGPVAFYAPLETAIGVAALVACLLWLAWRTHDERIRALQRAAASSGVRISRRPSRVDRRRTLLGGGILVGALVIAVAVVPFAARGSEREVLRSAIGPDVDLSAEVSPLAQYRALFSNERADDVLFTVEPSGGELPERVRLATLDAYDGEVFRTGGAGAVDAGRFVRVPSTLDAGDGAPVEARIAIDGLDGVWMPTAGRLEAVEFGGGRAASLADRFYYNAAAAAGVQTAGGGLEQGDAYVVRGVEPETADLAEVQAPGGLSAEVPAPETLRTWVDEHAVGSDGPALAGLVELLRDRGYLSHGLVEGDVAPVWTTALSDYAFQPSASGHSLARIDTMFARLLERESDPRAAASGNYVAAVGDDEQFATAVALIAGQLGFPARVVVGARLTPEPGLAGCGAGVCRAQDLAAWTEVQSADGEWIAVDVTPQYAQSPSMDVTEQRDPENVTEVRPDSVEEVVPPDPAQEDSASDPAADDDAGTDLAWLWPVLRASGVVLLLLLLAFGPFAIILGAKAARRRSRRLTGTPAARVAGGWDEYVDAAVDAGHDAPRRLTRSELAGAFAGPVGADLARSADRAVFSHALLAAEDAQDYWNAVDDERRRLRRERGVWRGLLATVSLRSLLRPLAPETGAQSRFAERGRGRTRPVRPMP
jgi:hypothetical protein